MTNEENYVTINDQPQILLQRLRIQNIVTISFKYIWIILSLVGLVVCIKSWTIVYGNEAYFNVWKPANCTIVHRPVPCVVDFKCPDQIDLIHYETLNFDFCIATTMYRYFYWNNETRQILWPGEYQTYHAKCEFYFALSLIPDYIFVSILLIQVIRGHVDPLSAC